MNRRLLDGVVTGLAMWECLVEIAQASWDCWSAGCWVTGGSYTTTPRRQHGQDEENGRDVGHQMECCYTP